MSRKIQWRDGQIRRRSPRISALDVRGRDSDRDEEQRTIRTNKIKRRFDDAVGPLKSTSKLAKQVWKGRDDPQNEDHLTKYMDWRSGRESQENHKHNACATADGKASIMPAKHILELVLDTLQRRDTYEIFAEPVDPDEVEEYYEIIKEPMDFGTMRAKLHEGMYENIQQFEHDVYLIPENAMHFNSSTTVYFRQARAIHELAKKLFDVLKTDPENFVSEFSGTRRRSMRKALSDTKDSNFLSFSKPSTKSNDVSSKGTLPSPLGSSIFRRTSKKNPGCTGMTDHFRSRNFLTGKRDGRFTSSEVADTRSTWRSPSLYDEKDYFGSTFPLLVLMNQGDISYEDSLLSFVKDLGPVAQMVAKRKLSVGQHGSKCDQIQSKSGNVDAAAVKTNNNNNNTFRTFRDFADGRHPSFLKASNIIDLTEDGGGLVINKEVVKYSSSDPPVCGGTRGKEKINPPPPVVTLTTPGPGCLAVDTTIKQGGFAHETRKSSSTKMRRGSCSSSLGKPGDDDNVRPVILALENNHSIHVAEFKSRNKKSSQCTVPPLKSQSQGSHSRLPPLPPPPPALESGVEKEKGTAAQPMPIVSQFTFDLPFLKARLSQMNVMGFHTGGGVDHELKNGGGEELERAIKVESFGINRAFPYNHQSSLSLSRPPFDKLVTSLALQL